MVAGKPKDLLRLATIYVAGPERTESKISEINELSLGDSPRHAPPNVCMHKRHILFVNAEGHIGGAEKSLLLLINYLTKHHYVAVACPNHSPLAERITQLGYEHYGLSLRKCNNRLASKVAHTALANLRLRKISSAIKADVIHANSIYATILCLLPALCSKAQLVWHARDFIGREHVSRMCSVLCTKIIAVSQSIRNTLIAQGVAKSKIEVIPNGIDLSSSLQCKTMQEHPDVVDRGVRSCKVFANVGQFVPWKKQHHFLEAASIALHKIPEARFWLVGDDVFGRNSEYKSQLEGYVTTNRLSDVVGLLGWQDKMEPIWKRIDCLVHTADKEPFGRVIIEAMAAGVPVIAVRSCGPAEILEDGVTGILVQPNNAKAIANAMVRIAQNRQLTNRLATAARERVLSDFSAEETATRIETLYSHLISDS